jgi:hypothetical protein
MVNEMGGGSLVGRQIGSYTLLSLLGGFSPQIIDIDWF